MANNGISNDTICLVCNSNLENSSCINIFCTSLSRNEELLASFVLGILHPSALELNSNYICTQCYNLFQILEQARWTATNIENEIFRIYQSSREKRKLIRDRSAHATANVNEQYVHIQSLQSYNVECDISGKNIPTIIEDIHLTNSHITKTPLVNISTNDSDSFTNNESEQTSVLLIADSLNEVTNQNQKSTKTELNNYQCKICTRCFKSVSDLDAHLLEHEQFYPYKCEECEEEFVDLSNANSHSVTIHGEAGKFIIVNTVEPLNTHPIEFTNQQDCIDHKNNTKILDSIIVDNNTCGTFNDNNDTESQDAVNNLTNSKCNEVKSSNKKINARSTKTAKKSNFKSKQLNYSCPTCEKMWKTSSELKSHMKTHSSVRPHMCEKCGQAYKHKHALEIHIGMHNGINPFQCDFCNKCFTQKGALMRHLPIHTGEMPYQCEICGKRFVHHTSYNMHTLSHTGKKTHQCPHCNLSLLSTSHLKRHMRVHTGEKPYSCPSCGKCFAERYNLCAHQKIHGPTPINSKLTKKSEYKCDQCLAIFDVEEQLQNHIQQQHQSQIQMEKDSEWVTQRGEPVSVNQITDNNWDNFPYPRPIQSGNQPFND